MTRQTKATLLTASLCSLAVGCSSGSSTPQKEMCFGANVVANEANNYSFMSTITLSPVTVKDMSNLMFDWSGVSKDFLGHSLTPATGLNSAIVMLWDLDLSHLETALNADMLFTQDLIVSPPLSLALSGQTAANLYAFTINGTAVTADMFNQYFDSTLYTPANSTFLVGVQQGTELGRNIKMLQAFQISASSSATKVTLTNDSTKLAYSANLHNLTITGMPAGTPALMLDWGQMHTNAMGAPFDATAITSAVVGHYTQSASELESKFLDLDTLATNYYRVNIDSGSVLDFTMLKDDKSGASFPGITSDGTWLVGLICGNCRNPAPWYMTILKPCTM